MLLNAFKSIYKQAYVKGIASAVVLTAGLAAGAANADPGAWESSDTWPTAGQEDTLSGGAVTISSDTAADGGTLIINNGASSLTVAASDGDAITVSGDGALKVQSGASTAFTVSVAANSGSATVDLGSFELLNGQSGSVSNAASSADSGATLSADVIRIDGDGTTLTLSTNASGTSTLGQFTGSGSNTAGDVITVSDGATIVLSGGGADSGNATIAGKSLTVTGATIDVTSADSTANEITTSHVVLNDGALIKVGSGSNTATLNIKLADDSGYAAGTEDEALNQTLVMNEGSLFKVDSGSTVNLTAGTIQNVNGVFEVIGTVNVSGDGTDNGSLVIGSDNGLQAVGETGDHKLSVQTNGTLTLSNAALKNFLSDEDAYERDQTQEIDGTTGSKVTDVAGALELSGGTLAFTEDVTVSDYASLISGSAAQGKIGVTAQSTVSAADHTITIDSDIDNGSGLDLKAAGIVYDDSSNTHGISGGVNGNNIWGQGLKSTEASELLSIISDSVDRAVVIDHNVTLDTGDDDNEATDTAAGSFQSIDQGSITGNNSALVIDGASTALTVKKGEWTTDKLSGIAIVSGGSLAVTSSADYVDGDDAILRVNGEFNLNSGSVTVSGNGSTALLDLTGADLTAENVSDGTNTYTAGSATLQAQGGGTIALNGEDFENLITGDAFKTNVEASVSGGTFVVEGDVNLTSGSQIVSGASAAAGKFTFEGSNKGTLDVNGTLSIVTAAGSTGDVTLDIGDANYLKADTLNLTATGKVSSDTTKTDDLVTLKEGNFVVSSLTTGNDYVQLGSGASGASLYFVDNGAESNSVSTKLVTASDATADNTITVTDGTWTFSDITLGTSGAFTVGLTVANADLGFDAATTADVTVSAIKAVAGSDITVNEGSTAIFGRFDVAGAAVTASGDITVKGADPSGEDDTALQGVNIAGTTVAIGEDVTFTLGSDVVNAEDAFVKNDDGKTVDVVSQLDATFTFAGTAATSQLVLDFSEGTSFNIDQLNSIKTVLTGSADISNGFLNIRGAGIDGLTTGENALIKDGEVKYDDFAKFDDVLSDVTNDVVSQVGVTDVDAGDTLRGSIGYVRTNGSSFTTGGNLVLNNAKDGLYAADAGGNASDVTVVASTTFSLKDAEGGAVGTVNLGNDAVFGHNEGVNTVDGITGSQGSVVDTGTLISTDSVDVGDLSLDGDDSLTVETASAADSYVRVNGDFSLLKGGSLTADTFYYKGTAATNEALVGDALDVSNIVIESGNAWFFGNASGEYSVLRAGTSSSNAAGVTITMGLSSAAVEDLTDSAYDGDAEAALADGLASSSVRYGFETLDLNGATLYLDPDYGQAATVVAGEKLDTQSTTGDFKDSTVDGKIVVGQNSVMGLGAGLADTLAAVQDYMDGNGSLDKDGYGSILYVAKSIKVATGNSLAIDSAEGQTLSEIQTAKGSAGFYMGDNAALIIEHDAIADGRTAITFDESSKVSVNVSAQDPESEAGITSRVILNGNLKNNGSYQIFENAQAAGIDIVNDIYVQSQNRLFNGVISAADDTGAVTMNVDLANARGILSGASDPVFSHLMAYAMNDRNWASSGEDNHETAELSGEQYITQEAYEALTEGQSGYKPVDSTDLTRGYVSVAQSDFLDTVISTGNGADAESVARLAVYGGAAEVALAASSVTSDAIASRMGMGNPNGNLVMADNEKGAGLWLAPVYKNHESDDFDAEGVNYGVDLDLTGVALGADYTFGSNLRAGAMFSVGSGDADGQGAGSAVSNDFDFWSVGVYGGYAYEAFSLTADLSWTQVDNDIDANTAAAGKVSASMDADVLSAGLTAKYDFDLDMVKVAPHLGMRYTSIDIDDYTVSDIASSDVDSISVFSIPAGVTFSTEIASASGWNVKPALDLTVTLNTGDDEVDSDVRFNGVDMTTDLTSEFIDDVTYGATVGVQVQKDAFQFGLGVNYTGSDNTDEFGVGANARFTF